MTNSLPARPSLENLKKQAKTLLKSHHSGDPNVCAILRRLNRFARLSDQQILSSELALAEAQYALAMDYGFPSWSALKDAVIGHENDARFLHLQCGDTSAENLRRSGVPGKVSVWYDAFTGGAVPEGVSDEEWFALRASASLDRFDTLESGISFFKEMYKQLEEYSGFAEVVLWFDACLYDQTILIHHLDWFSRRDMGKTKLSLICIGEFPGMPKFKGLGELRPDQMASLLDTRHLVTKSELDLASIAWSAYRSPDPLAIEELLSQDTTALPFLASAFRRHLQRFPSVRNGLNREEQASLDVIAEGHTGFVDLFFRATDIDNPPYMGDTMLLSELVKLTQAAHPVIEIRGLEHTQGLRQHQWPLKKISFHLTEAGRDVLAGRADMIQLNGIDRWMGGVHLHGQESDWRWNQESENLVKMKGK